jgi:hypothetical protein
MPLGYAASGMAQLFSDGRVAIAEFGCDVRERPSQVMRPRVFKIGRVEDCGDRLFYVRASRSVTIREHPSMQPRQGAQMLNGRLTDWGCRTAALVSARRKHDPSKAISRHCRLTVSWRRKPVRTLSRIAAQAVGEPPSYSRSDFPSLASSFFERARFLASPDASRRHGPA